MFALFPGSRVKSISLALAIMLTGPCAWGHVTLDEPNGGEYLEVGSEYTIQWRVVIQHQTENWDLYYSNSGSGGPWIPIATDLELGDPTAGSIHTYDWTVPDDATLQARVRIVQDNFAGDYQDISNGNFVIFAPEVDTAFLDVDLIPIPAPEKSPAEGDDSVVEELQGIVVLCAIPLNDESFVRALTINGTTGATVFGPVDFYQPPDPCLPPSPIHPPDPGRILLSRHFLPGQVIVMNADNSLYSAALTFAFDHPPEPGAWDCHPPPDDQLPWGLATALGELPGSEFGDGMPRLFIGTDMGQILVMTEDPTGGPGPILSEVYDLVGGGAINSLGPIPQVGSMVLGAATGSIFMGIEPEPFGPSVKFQFNDPTSSPISDFAVSDLSPPPDDTQPVNLVLVDGVSTDIKLASIPADAFGSNPLNIFGSTPPDDGVTGPVSQIASGSLLMLTGDGNGVWYDPQFTDSTGPSDCAANLIDEFPDECSCCVDRVGDANGLGSDEPTIGDVSVLIDAKFITGTCDGVLACIDEADINQSGGSGAVCDDITIGDISTLIDYLFITGSSLGLADCL